MITLGFINLSLLFEFCRWSSNVLPMMVMLVLQQPQQRTPRPHRYNHMVFWCVTLTSIVFVQNPSLIKFNRSHDVISLSSTNQSLQPHLPYAQCLDHTNPQQTNHWIFSSPGEECRHHLELNIDDLRRNITTKHLFILLTVVPAIKSRLPRH